MRQSTKITKLPNNKLSTKLPRKPPTTVTTKPIFHNSMTNSNHSNTLSNNSLDYSIRVRLNSTLHRDTLLSVPIFNCETVSQLIRKLLSLATNIKYRDAVLALIQVQENEDSLEAMSKMVNKFGVSTEDVAKNIQCWPELR